MNLPQRISLTLLAFLGLAACRDEKDTGSGKDIDGEITWTFEFALAADAVNAGDSVDYSAELVGSDGSRVAAVIALLDDLEPGLVFDTSKVWPTLAGTHVLTASTETEAGEGLLATDTLLVNPGAATSLDLSLAEGAAMAGDRVTYEITASDRYGNAIDPASATLGVSSSRLVIEGDAVYSTVPGVYTLTASLGGTSDSETLVVSAGYPASIDLWLTDTRLEVNETSSAFVTVYDAWGNETDDPWSLYVEADLGDAASVTIAYNNLTFTDEGVFTVVASAENPPGNVVEARVGPLMVDSSGPLLEIYTPARGTFSTSLSGTVTGQVRDETSGLVSLTVDGFDVTPAADGSFSTPVDHVFGTKVIRSYAVDADDNASEDLRAVLTGSFLAYGSSLTSGIVARLNESGLDTLEAMGEGLISASDLSALIPSPVYSNSYSVWGVTLYSLNLYASNPSFTGQDLELDPLSTGYLRAMFTVYNPSIDWRASGRVAGISYSASGRIYASSITADMQLLPVIRSGNISVLVRSCDVSSVGFTFDWDSWIYSLMSFFGIDLSSTIQGYMEDSLEQAIEDEVPGAVEDALQDLELATDIPLMGNTYSLDAVPSRITVDNTGLSLALSTTFTAASWVASRTGPGSLYSAYSAPSYTGTPGMVLSVSEDFLNQALYAFWGGGLLDVTMTDRELGIDPSSLAFIFPGVTSFTVDTEALLPPVVLPGTGESLLDLQLGDFKLSLYGGPVVPGAELLQAYVHITAGLDVEAADEVLSAELGAVAVRFDVVIPEANSIAAADTETLLGSIVPMFLPTLTDALSEIPIPAISGFELSGISISLAGAENGYLNLSGDLVVY